MSDWKDGDILGIAKDCTDYPEPTKEEIRLEIDIPKVEPGLHFIRLGFTQNGKPRIQFNRANDPFSPDDGVITNIKFNLYREDRVEKRTPLGPVTIARFVNNDGTRDPCEVWEYIIDDIRLLPLKKETLEESTEHAKLLAMAVVDKLEPYADASFDSSFTISSEPETVYDEPHPLLFAWRRLQGKPGQADHFRVETNLPYARGLFRMDPERKAYIDVKRNEVIFCGFRAIGSGLLSSRHTVSRKGLSIRDLEREFRAIESSLRRRKLIPARTWAGGNKILHALAGISPNTFSVDYVPKGRSHRKLYRDSLD